MHISSLTCPCSFVEDWIGRGKRMRRKTRNRPIVGRMGYFRRQRHLLDIENGVPQIPSDVSTRRWHNCVLMPISKEEHMCVTCGSCVYKWPRIVHSSDPGQSASSRAPFSINRVPELTTLTHCNTSRIARIAINNPHYHTQRKGTSITMLRRF